MATESGLSKAPRWTSDNMKITTGDQVKIDSAIDTVIRQLQRRCLELESSLTFASNAHQPPQPCKGTLTSIGRYWGKPTTNWVAHLGQQLLQKQW